MSDQRVLRFNVVFKQEMFDRIEKFCAVTGVKPNDYIRRCVELAADKVESEALEKPEVKKCLRGTVKMGKDALRLAQSTPSGAVEDKLAELRQREKPE